MPDISSIPLSSLSLSSPATLSGEWLVDRVESSTSQLALPTEASDDGAAIAAAIAGCWLHPETALTVSVDPPPTSVSEPHEAALLTLSDGVYPHFLSQHATGPTPLPPRVPRSLFASSVPWCLQWPLFFSGYVADAHVQRGTAAIYLVLCAIGSVWRNHDWYWYVLSGMTADSGFRVLERNRAGASGGVEEIWNWDWGMRVVPVV